MMFAEFKKHIAVLALSGAVLHAGTTLWAGEASPEPAALMTAADIDQALATGTLDGPSRYQLFNNTDEALRLLTDLYPESFAALTDAEKALFNSNTTPLASRRREAIDAFSAIQTLRDLQLVRLLELYRVRADIKAQLPEYAKENVVTPGLNLFELPWVQSWQQTQDRRYRWIQQASTAINIRFRADKEDLDGVHLPVRYLAERAKLIGIENIDRELTARIQFLEYGAPVAAHALLPIIFKRASTKGVGSVLVEPQVDDVADFRRLANLALAPESVHLYVLQRANATDSFRLSKLVAPGLGSETPSDDNIALMEAVPYLNTAAVAATSADKHYRPASEALLTQYGIDRFDERRFMPQNPNWFEFVRIVAAAPAFDIQKSGGYLGAIGDWTDYVGEQRAKRLGELKRMRDSLRQSYGLYAMEEWRDRQRGSAEEEYEDYLAALRTALEITDAETKRVVEASIPHFNALANTDRGVYDNVQEALHEAGFLTERPSTAMEMLHIRQTRLSVQNYLWLRNQYSYDEQYIYGPRREANQLIVSSIPTLVAVAVPPLWSSIVAPSISTTAVGQALPYLASGGLMVAAGVDQATNMYDQAQEAYRLSRDNPFGPVSVPVETYERLRRSFIWSTIFLGLDTVTLGVDVAGIARSGLGNAAPIRKLNAAIEQRFTTAMRPLTNAVATRRALQVENAALWEEVERLRKMAFRDAMTGAYNRHAMEEFWPKIVAMVKRSDLSVKGGPITLLKIDIDNFKWINDVRGYDIGDSVIVGHVEKIMEAARLRESDWIVRLGGDEIVVILPNTDMAGAEVVARRIQQVISDDPLVREHSTAIVERFGRAKQGDRDAIDEIVKASRNEFTAAKIAASNCPDNIGTVSIGIVQRDGQETLADMLAHAETNLKKAKLGGRRNCIATDLGVLN